MTRLPYWRLVCCGLCRLYTNNLITEYLDTETCEPGSVDIEVLEALGSE